MHIVVGSACDDEELALEVLGTAQNGTFPVTFGILLRCAHKALGVDGVVELKVGDRGHSHTSLEHIVATTHRHQRVISTETPSPDTDTTGIDIGQRGSITTGRQLVLCLTNTQFAIDLTLPLSTTTGRATTVDSQGYEALLCQIYRETEFPTVEHLL